MSFSVFDHDHNPIFIKTLGYNAPPPVETYIKSLSVRSAALIADHRYLLYSLIFLRVLSYSQLS